MSKIHKILAEVDELSDEDITTLMAAVRARQAKIHQKELVEYARQAAVDLRNGKLKPQSVAEIMGDMRAETEED